MQPGPQAPPPPPPQGGPGAGGEYLKREDVVGKTVIDGRGNSLGVVKDIAFSVRGEIAFLVEKKDGSLESVPLTRVERIGEYIVLYKEMAPGVPGQPGRPMQAGQPVQQEEFIICPVCGYKNPPGTEYCLRCGAKLPRKKRGILGGFKI